MALAPLPPLFPRSYKHRKRQSLRSVGRSRFDTYRVRGMSRRLLRILRHFRSPLQHGHESMEVSLSPLFHE
jgi:hypothetical protein